MELLISLVAVVLVAIGVAFSLLRHAIVLAFRLAVPALLVIAGLWVWQHRADLEALLKGSMYE
jgi:glycerol-3-phosphate acyltransferase PlsY